MSVPTCPKCGNPTILQRNLQSDFMGNKTVYRFACISCEIFGTPIAENEEKAAQNFEEVAKQYKPLEAPRIVNLDDNGSGLAIGKHAQLLEAGTDLNEINAAGIYSVDTSNTPDCTAIYYNNPEQITKIIKYMRAQGYIVEATAKGIIIQGKAVGG